MQITISAAEQNVYKMLRSGKAPNKVDITSLKRQQVVFSASRALMSRLKNNRSINIPLMLKYMTLADMAVTGRAILEECEDLELRKWIESQLRGLTTK